MRMLAAISLVLLSASAQAHHSGAMFDGQKTKTLTGTVRSFQFNNPHCYIQLMTEKDGRSEEWSIELAAPSHLQRLGWRRNTLTAGDRITVTIAPLRDGSAGGEIREISYVDGSPLQLAR